MSVRRAPRPPVDGRELEITSHISRADRSRLMTTAALPHDREVFFPCEGKKSNK
jgi:hypothetical protein